VVIVLREGLIGALILSAGAVMFAVLGLSPGLQWIPELPLLTAGALFPIVVCGLIGFRAARATRGLRSGAFAGAIAGAVGGAAGGGAYMIFGKPALNVVVGVLMGLVGGAVLATLGAVAGLRAART
jgi:hypothetical protein